MNNIKVKPLAKALAITLSLPIGSSFSGTFRFTAYYPSTSINDDYIEFIENRGINGNHPVINRPKTATYWEQSPGTNWTSVDVNSTNPQTYKNPLKYDADSSILNGSSNAVMFRFNTAYSSNILFTYKVDANNKTRIGDARQKILLGGGTFGFEWLDTISNAVDGQIYGTNWVNIAPIETRITNFFLSNGGSNATLSARARPGTVVWPEYTTNLLQGWTNAGANSVQLTNRAKYVAVNADNFGGFDSLTWTNLPMPSNAPAFYRLRCDSYNPVTSNLLRQSEAPVLGVSKAKTNLEAKLSTPAKQPFYKSLQKYKQKKDAAYKR